MLFRMEWFTSSWWLDKLSAWRMAMAVVGLVAYAVFLRCFHLFNHNNYYVLSADSYFFQWLSRRLAAGEGPPPDMPYGALHTGLAYPVAYISKVVGFLFNISLVESVDIVCKLIPPLLGIISLIVIYLVATRIWNRKVGLFSALTWAILAHAVYVGAAGYLDRDGLTILLLIVGSLLFYLSSRWHLNVGTRNMAWLLTGLIVLGVEALLYIEWGFVGPLLLCAIIAAYSLAKYLVVYANSAQAGKSIMLRLKDAFGEVNWRALLVIVGANIVVIALKSDAVSWLSTSTFIAQQHGNIGVAELKGLSIGDLIFGYGLFLIPTVIGLYVTWKKHNDGAIFFACWFLSFLVMSLFAGRILFFAAPAAAILSGLGLAFLWDWRWGGQYQKWKLIGVVALLCLLVLVSFSMVTSLGSNPLIAADTEWQDAMAYIKDTNNTPEDSVIMTQWGWGFWILDLGERKPFMDNGFYGYDDARMRDVALAYLAVEPAEAVQIMNKYGADYLIFSKLDLDFAGTIMGWAGLDNNNNEFPEDSLFMRSINSEYESGGGLEVVYRSAPDSEVVILALTQS